MIVFIYEKDGQIICHGIEDAKKYQDNLKSKGWNHVKTLDAGVYLQFLHNVCKDIESEVKSLSEK